MKSRTIMSKLDIDKDVIRELAEIMNETGLAEIEVESGNSRLRVSRGPSSVAAAAPQIIAAPVVSAPAEIIVAPIAEAASHPGAVKSPMVGTAYLSPEPGAAVFITVGSSVAQGQTILIVEAMKTMNPIPAPKGGKIVEILVGDSEPVEFGQPLVIIE